RHDDGLGPIVGFLRNRKDRLLRVGGVSLLLFRRVGCARVERWQILFRRISYQRRRIKRGVNQNSLLSNPRERKRPYQSNSRHVHQRGLEEPPPGYFLRDEPALPQINPAVAGDPRPPKYRAKRFAKFANEF